MSPSGAAPHGSQGPGGCGRRLRTSGRQHPTSSTSPAAVAGTDRTDPEMGARSHLATATGCSVASLLERADQGDQSAWGQLVDRYDPLVRSVAGSFRLQAADVHDVAQTTWLRL